MTKAEWKSHSNKLFGALLNPASKVRSTWLQKITQVSHRQLTIWIQLERTNIIERPLLTVVQVSEFHSNEPNSQNSHRAPSSTDGNHPFFQRRKL